jgi:hypothetical protein
MGLEASQWEGHMAYMDFTLKLWIKYRPKSLNILLVYNKELYSSNTNNNTENVPKLVP